MSLGKHLVAHPALLVALLFAGCSAGSSPSSVNSIETAVQDLYLDADGLVTVVTLESAGGLAAATPANFTASGGQTALEVQWSDAVATVTWDARVSPAHTVSLIGLAGVSPVPHEVTSSDTSAPSYTVADAQMNAGLGADVIVLQFAGPHVVPASAEDVAHWSLEADGHTFDLTGSVLAFDSGAQTLTLDLGSMANVWADFTLQASGVSSVAEVAVDGADVAGTGSGDASAPAVVSAEQNLAEDLIGRVIDFSFDEAMSPLMFTQPGRYGGTGSDLAIDVVALSESVVRVTFNHPIVPGLDTVFLNGLHDVHGNALADTVQPITQPSPLPNAVSTPAQAVTLPNAGNDYITFVTDVPFDPDSALDWQNWTLQVAGNPVDLSTQSFAYDMYTRTTTITLDVDLLNGDSFTIAAPGVVDVDGVYSALGDLQTVAGDAAAPSVSTVVQNRSVDDSGSTVDVIFDEDVAEAVAEDTANWQSANGQAIVSATLQSSHNVVRLVFDAPLLPSLDTLVCTAVTDLAGNTTGFNAPVVSSTDTTAPAVSNAVALAVAGAGNDTLVVTFDDVMYETEVVDSSLWTLESPAGTALDLSGSTIGYDPQTRKATLTLSADGANLQNGNGFALVLAGVHDIAYNALSATPTTGEVVSETVSPEIEAAYIETLVADEVVLTFSEPCSRLDDLWDAGSNPTGTRFVLRDSGGALRGTATAASVLTGGLSVRLSFGVIVAAGDTLDVLGVADLAGNPLYPVLAQPLESEDGNAPALLSAEATTLSGESNDTLVLVFDRSMCAWGMTSPAHYTLTTAGKGTIGLNRAEFAFDGDATVTITLSSNTGNLSTGDTFTIEAAGLYSAQGVEIGGSTAIGPQAIGGDSAAPTVDVRGVTLDAASADSLLIEFSEALDPAVAAVPANYDLNGGNLAIAATLVSPRVVRATFAGLPLAGDSLDVVCSDLADNWSGVLTRLVQVADNTGPLVSGVAGAATTGYGGDTLSIRFSEPVKTATAFNLGNYTVTSNGVPISLVGAQASYVSATNVVVFHLASGQELDSAAGVDVTISGVEDIAGNAMAAPIATTGPVSGDATPPVIASSFVDWAADASGATVDVGFSEDVLASAAGSILNWTTSGPTSVSAVLRLSDRHYRVSFAAPLSSSELVTVAGISDPAGNAVGGSLASDPLE